MKENKITKKHLIIFLVCVLLLSGAVSYAYFTAQTNNRGVGVTTVSQTVEYEGTELVTKGEIEFSDDSILPGHKNVSSISVTATGLNNVIYNLNWTGTNSLNTPLTYTVYKTTTKETPSITCNRKTEIVTGETRYYEECSNSGFENLGSAIGTGTIGTSDIQTKVNLVINEEIQATREGNTVYYYVVLEYPNLEEPQNSDMGGSFSGIVNTEILGSKEEPIVELAEIEATESSNGWYSSVTITARASNSNNTVSAINSCITTEEECTPQSSRSVGGIEKSVTLNESNKLPQKVCFQAVDKNGVTGNIMCSNSYLIDNTSTTTSITLNESSVLGDNNWYQSLTLDIKGNNEISGINSLKYCITSTDECVPDQEVNGVSTSVTLESSAVGQKVCAQSIDNKGTTSEVACSNLYNVDTVNPTVVIKEDYNVTTDSITVNVTASDEDSKITSYNYTLNGSTYSSCTSETCTFTGLTGGTDYTVGVSVSDVSGRTVSIEKQFTTIKTASIDIQNLATAGLSANIDAGLYRYQGESGAVNNYICFGTNVKSTCTESSNSYMHRIIGIAPDGTMKLIKASTYTNTYWYSSNAATTWPSTFLYRTLQSYMNSFSEEWKNKVVDTNWTYTSITTDYPQLSTIYQQETSSGLPTVTAKAGLMYIHDYYYAYQSGGLNCAANGTSYSACRTSWIYNYEDEWTMTNYGLYSNGYYSAWAISYKIGNAGYIFSVSGQRSLSVRPVFYLKADVKLASGTGASTDPFILTVE